MMAQALDHPLEGLNPLLCARPECEAKAKRKEMDKWVCQVCHLVRYCSQSCCEQDKQNHDKLCRRHDEALRRMAQVDQRKAPRSCVLPDALYSQHNGVEALDLLNLEQKEGVHVDNMRVLLTNMEDLSTFIKTVAGIPNTCHAKWDFKIQCSSTETMAQTVIILLIACGQWDNPSVMAEALVHIWYSAFLPPWVFDILDMAVVRKLEEALGNRPIVQVAQMTFTCLQNRENVFTITVGQDTLDEIYRLAKDTTIPQKRAKESRDRAYGTSLPESRDAVDQWLSSLDRELVTSTIMYMESGIVLPLAAARDTSWRPNPYYFKENEPSRSEPFQLVGREPILRWHRSEVLAPGSAPTAPSGDRYGRFFYFMRQTLINFNKRLHRRGFCSLIDVRCCALQHLLALPDPKNGGHFVDGPWDRIDVGCVEAVDEDICDSCDWIPDLGSRLRVSKTAASSHATLITKSRLGIHGEVPDEALEIRTSVFFTNMVCRGMGVQLPATLCPQWHSMGPPHLANHARLIEWRRLGFALPRRQMSNGGEVGAQGEVEDLTQKRQKARQTLAKAIAEKAKVEKTKAERAEPNRETKLTEEVELVEEAKRAGKTKQAGDAKALLVHEMPASQTEADVLIKEDVKETTTEVLLVHEMPVSQTEADVSIKDGVKETTTEEIAGATPGPEGVVAANETSIGDDINAPTCAETLAQERVVSPVDASHAPSDSSSSTVIFTPPASPVQLWYDHDAFDGEVGRRVHDYLKEADESEGKLLYAAIYRGSSGRSHKASVITVRSGPPLETNERPVYGTVPIPNPDNFKPLEMDDC